MGSVVTASVLSVSLKFSQLTPDNVSMNNQELVILTDRKFSELCAILGVSKQCCLDPERKVIERAFRKKALKCHPDKGGDPVVFKKLNDAYCKLIGHILKVFKHILNIICS